MTLELVLIEEDWLNLSNLNLVVVLQVVEVAAVVLSLKRLMVASIDARRLTARLLTIDRWTSPVESTDPTQTMIDPLTTIRSSTLCHRAALELQQSWIDWLGH